jgi:hypothetical protein
MKTKIKRQGSTELPRFAGGALAIAGASTANAATVQISFANNLVNYSGYANFVPDLTGDGVADVRASVNARPSGGGYIPEGSVRVNSVLFNFEMGFAQNYSSVHVVFFNSQNVRSPAL